MKLDDLHEAIQEDNEQEAYEILQDLYMRWFAFGLGVGIVASSIFFVFIINKR